MLLSFVIGFGSTTTYYLVAVAWEGRRFVDKIGFFFWIASLQRKIVSAIKMEDRNTIPMTNMFSWKVTLLLYILQIHNVFAALNGETLVVGDSWAALSQNYLGTVCSLSTNDYTNVVRTI